MCSSERRARRGLGLLEALIKSDLEPSTTASSFALKTALQFQPGVALPWLPTRAALLPCSPSMSRSSPVLPPSSSVLRKLGRRTGSSTTSGTRPRPPGTAAPRATAATVTDLQTQFSRFFFFDSSTCNKACISIRSRTPEINTACPVHYCAFTASKISSKFGSKLSIDPHSMVTVLNYSACRSMLALLRSPLPLHCFRLCRFRVFRRNCGRSTV